MHKLLETYLSPISAVYSHREGLFRNCVFEAKLPTQPYRSYPLSPQHGRGSNTERLFKFEQTIHDAKGASVNEQRTQAVGWDSTFLIPIAFLARPTAKAPEPVPRSAQ